jgi:asparagine synthase (glutamine-hydrolysing)
MNESNNMIINKPMLKETYYYRKIYNTYYHKYEDIIPYYWLPKWCKETLIDPSAREIS